MKNQILTQIRQRIFVLMAVLVVIAGCMVYQAETKAAEDIVTSEDGVQYVKYSASDCELGTAPTYSGVDEGCGYLFGGWFTKSGDTWVPIQDEEAKDDAGSELYAKFVPSYVLSIKCQNLAGTTDAAESTSMRIISSVDSLQYEKVGFEFMRIRKNDADGSFSEKVEFGGDTAQTNKTYTSFNVYNNAEDTEPAATYSAEDIFGAAAEYLTAWQVTNIKAKDFGSIICIKPYWVTLDGAKVYGLTRYAHVEDEYCTYLNVPVNLNHAKKVAAGLLTVQYDSETFTLQDAECGRVFDEMEWKDDGAGNVRFLGNVAEISDGNQASDDILVNLRFKVKDNVTLEEGRNTFSFSVIEESFTDIDETALFTSTDYNVWDVSTAILK